MLFLTLFNLAFDTGFVIHSCLDADVLQIFGGKLFSCLLSFSNSKLSVVSLFSILSSI